MVFPAQGYKNRNMIFGHCGWLGRGPDWSQGINQMTSQIHPSPDNLLTENETVGEPAWTKFPD